MIKTLLKIFLIILAGFALSFLLFVLFVQLGLAEYQQKLISGHYSQALFCMVFGIFFYLYEGIYLPGVIIAVLLIPIIICLKKRKITKPFIAWIIIDIIIWSAMGSILLFMMTIGP